MPFAETAKIPGEVVLLVKFTARMPSMGIPSPASAALLVRVTVTAASASRRQEIENGFLVDVNLRSFVMCVASYLYSGNRRQKVHPALSFFWYDSRRHDCRGSPGHHRI